MGDVKTVLFIVLLTTFAFLVEGNVKKKVCPPEEQLTSCRCISFTDFNVLNCANIANVWDLVQDLHGIKDYPIHQVNLFDANFQYLPAGFLKFLPIVSLTIRDSTILALESEDGKVMFEGAVESLEDIFIIAVAGVTSWRWEPLEALTNLKILEVSTCEISGINSDFGRFSTSLEQISLLNNEISFIDDEAFSSYSKLKKLNLANNEIADVKRSMFPNPANSLEELKLSKNKIESLPSDIFTNMPQLKEIGLSRNNIKWLNEEPFAPVIGHLEFLLLEENEIHCCPSIGWVITSGLKKHIRGTCSFPQVLSEKEISTLDTADLDHGMC